MDNQKKPVLEPCTEPILTKLSTDHPLVKGIIFFSNDGPFLSQMGKNDFIFFQPSYWFIIIALLKDVFCEEFFWGVSDVVHGPFFDLLLFFGHNIE